MSRGKDISLVLGSGGARGLAHIGVIEWLEAHGYRIRSIAGASMGALVGGIYAAGELDTYKHWVSALDRTDVLRLLDLSFGWSGLFKGDRVIERLRDLIGERNIEDLAISFTAVATDVEQQREVWLQRGPLFDAIRASIAVPLVFTPFRVRGRPLLDGGLINPVPIAPTLSDHTDLTIAVNASGPAAGRHRAPSPPPARNEESYRARIKAFIDELQEKVTRSTALQWNYFDIMSMSLETMQSTITRLKLAAYNPDAVLEIPRDAAGAFEFYRARELIELGRQLAEEVLGEREPASRP